MSNIFVKLPTGDIEIDHIREMYRELKNTSFEHKNWKPRAALIERNRGNAWLYTGQKYDPKYIALVEDGWTHDHCEICSITITDTKSEYTITSGFYNGSEWVCESCYEKIIATNDLEKKLTELPKYQK